MKSILFAILSVAAISQSVSALTLAEKKVWAQWQKEMTDEDHNHFAKYEKNCGKKVDAKMDEKLTPPFVAENTSAWSYCDEAISTIAWMCEDATSKAEIAKKIQHVSCKLGEKEKGTFELKSGTPTFTYGVGFSNIQDKLKTYLEGAL